MNEGEIQDIIREAVEKEHRLDERCITSREWSEIFAYLDECFDKESVLEDMKAEIKEHTQRYTLARESGGMGQVDWSDYLIKADDVIKIIDKHTSGKEKE